MLGSSNNYNSINTGLLQPINYHPFRLDILLLWFILLIVGYVETDFLCKYTIDMDDCKIFNPVDRVKELIHVLIYGTIIYYFGNISTITYNKLSRWYFVPIVLISIPLFSLLQNVDFLQIALTTRSIKYQWTSGSWVVVSSVAIIIIASVIYHIKLAFRTKDTIHIFYNRQIRYGVVYILTAVLMAILFTACYIYLLLIDTDFIVHFHHWFFFWVLSMFLRFETHPSVISQALCVGLFIQGIAAYGSQSIICDSY